MRHARVPHRLPAQLRLRRVAVAVLAGRVLGRRAARHPRPPRSPRQRADAVAALGHAARAGLLAPHGHLRDAPPDPRRHRRHRPAAGARRTVPEPAPDPARRPGAAAGLPTGAGSTTSSATSSRPRRPAPCRWSTEAGPLTPAETEAYAAELAVLPGVARVDAATGTYCAEGVAEQFGCEPGSSSSGPRRPTATRASPTTRAATCRSCRPSSRCRRPASTSSHDGAGPPVARSRAGHGHVGRARRRQRLVVRPAAVSPSASSRSSRPCCCS